MGSKNLSSLFFLRESEKQKLVSWKSEGGMSRGGLDWSAGSIRVEKNLYGKITVRKICLQIWVDK